MSKSLNFALVDNSRKVWLPKSDEAASNGQKLFNRSMEHLTIGHLAVVVGVLWFLFMAAVGSPSLLLSFVFVGAAIAFYVSSALAQREVDVLDLSTSSARSLARMLILSEEGNIDEKELVYARRVIYSVYRVKGSIVNSPSLDAKLEEIARVAEENSQTRDEELVEEIAGSCAQHDESLAQTGGGHWGAPQHYYDDEPVAPAKPTEAPTAPLATSPTETPDSAPTANTAELPAATANRDDVVWPRNS